MSHKKNKKKSITVLQWHDKECNDWQLLLHWFFLSEPGVSRDSMRLQPVPRCLSARAACGGVSFTDSLGVSSGLRYQAITDANAAWERCAQAREDLQCQQEGHCSLEAVFVLCSHMAPPAFGEVPESTDLPTTKECEASSMWGKVMEREVGQGNLTE